MQHHRSLPPYLSKFSLRQLSEGIDIISLARDHTSTPTAITPVCVGVEGVGWGGGRGHRARNPDGRAWRFVGGWGGGRVGGGGGKREYKIDC